MSRFIGYPTAVVSGAPAWLLSKILRSPSVATVVSNPPRWVDRADLTATVAAIHQAAKAFETASAALERENATVPGAVTLESRSDWTVGRAADYLRLSRRRVQELASQLGGRRVGRQWILDEVAVREFDRQRKGVRARDRPPGSNGQRGRSRLVDLPDICPAPGRTGIVSKTSLIP